MRALPHIEKKKKIHKPINRLHIHTTKMRSQLQPFAGPLRVVFEYTKRRKRNPEKKENRSNASLEGPEPGIEPGTSRMLKTEQPKARIIPLDHPGN